MLGDLNDYNHFILFIVLVSICLLLFGMTVLVYKTLWSASILILSILTVESVSKFQERFQYQLWSLLFLTRLYNHLY